MRTKHHDKAGKGVAPAQKAVGGTQVGEKVESKYKPRTPGRKPDVLTYKQQKFVEAWEGDSTAAAKAAGLGNNIRSWRTLGHSTIHLPKVIKAIKARQGKEESPAVADRRARQEFWTQVMRDEERPMSDRMKASELLAKSEGDFLERVVSLNVDARIEKNDQGQLQLAPIPSDEEVRQTAQILLEAVNPGFKKLASAVEIDVDPIPEEIAK